MPHVQCHQLPLRVDRDDAVEITLILQTCLLCIACRMQCRAQSPSAPCDKNIAIDNCFSTGVVMLNCLLTVLCCFCSFVVYDHCDGRWQFAKWDPKRELQNPKPQHYIVPQLLVVVLTTTHHICQLVLVGIDFQKIDSVCLCGIVLKSIIRFTVWCTNNSEMQLS